MITTSAFKNARRILATALSVSLAAISLTAAPLTATASGSSSDGDSSRPVAVAGVTSATVSYKSAGTGYTYRVRYAASPYKNFVSYAPTTTALRTTVTPLTAGVSYVFQVSSRKGTGSWGSWSSSSNPVTPTGAPVISTYTIAASAGTGGTISPAGTTTVNSGASQTYSISAGAGYQIASVLVDGTSVGSVATYTFSNVTASHTIAASFSVRSFGITATSGANGTVTPVGTTNVNYAGSQTYAIMPDLNYHVASVLVDGTSVGAVTTYTFSNVTATHTISATFAIDTNNITASVDYGSGTISPSGVTAVNHGANQTYTITAASGYRLNNIYVDGVLVANAASYTFSNVTATHTIMVSFVLDVYTVTASAGTGGTISPSGATTVNAGSAKTFTITPDNGYQISTVTVDGSSAGTVGSYTFTNVTTDHTIDVTFSIITYDITASSGAHGTVTPVGTTTVNYGGGQTYAITPDSYYKVDDVLVDGVSVGPVTSYTFSNVAAGHTISATFAVSQYTIDAFVDAGNGTISPNGTTGVNPGEGQTYTFTPDTNNHIVVVYVDGVDQGAIDSYTFSNVQENHSLYVVFAVDRVLITSSTVYGRGYVDPEGDTYVAKGSDYTYTFTNYGGAFIADVVIDGVSIGTPSSYTFYDVQTTHDVKVYFEQYTPRVYATVDYGFGTSSLDGYWTLDNGDNYTVTFTPDPGYYIDTVYVDGVNVGSVSSYTFFNIKNNHEIYVGFSQVYTSDIAASVDFGNGTISPNGTTSVEVLQDQTYTITPDAGWHILDVVVDGVSKGAISTYTFTAVRTGHQIYAQFEADPPVTPTGFTLTYDSNTDQSGTDSQTHTQLGEGSINIEYNDYVAADGASFWGWNTAKDGKGTWYYPEDAFDLTADTTLYAIWYFDATFNIGALDYGYSSSMYVIVSVPTVDDPGTVVDRTYYAGDTVTLKLMAHQPGPWYVKFTGAYGDPTQPYSGLYTFDRTGINDYASTGIARCYLPDGTFGLMALLDWPYGAVTVSLNWTGA